MEKMQHHCIHCRFGFPCDLVVSTCSFGYFTENPNPDNPLQQTEMSYNRFLELTSARWNSHCEHQHGAAAVAMQWGCSCTRMAPLGNIPHLPELHRADTFLKRLAVLSVFALPSLSNCTNKNGILKAFNCQIKILLKA